MSWQLQRDREILAGTARLEWQRWSTSLREVLQPWREMAASTASVSRQISMRRSRQLSESCFGGWLAAAGWAASKRNCSNRACSVVWRTRARRVVLSWRGRVRRRAAADGFFVSRELARTAALLQVAFVCCALLASKCDGRCVCGVPIPETFTIQSVLC